VNVKPSEDAVVRQLPDDPGRPRAAISS
jgi:hypothetical protein